MHCNEEQNNFFKNYYILFMCFMCVHACVYVCVNVYVSFVCTHAWTTKHTWRSETTQGNRFSHELSKFIKTL